VCFIIEFFNFSDIVALAGNGVTCSGNSDGLGTYARYNSITGLAVLNSVITGVEAAVYIADSGNNKIRMVELTSGVFKSVTFDSNVGPNYYDPNYYANIDPNSQLSGLTVYVNELYACIVGAIVKYTIDTSTYLILSGTSKTIYSGSYSGLKFDFVFALIM